MQTRADQTTQPCQPLLQQALQYAEDGWPIFPVWPRGKKPLTTHGVKEATASQATVGKWWRQWPNANIGLAVPRGFIVLDVDSPDALRSLKFQDMELPTTSTSITARGWHFWYSVSRAVRNCVGVFPGVDIRSSSGGYVVVPPSTHSSGVAYRWQVPLDRNAITGCPEWLRERVTERLSHRHQSRSAEDWHQAIKRPVSEGRRNQSLAEVTGLLFRFLPARVAAELAVCWAQVKLQPALPAAEVLRTIDSIAGRELRRKGGS